MIYEKGVNDTEKGWTRKNEENKRIYRCWYSMLTRCYSKKFHELHKSYENCYACNRWLKLSNFAEDVKLLENYDKWLENNKKYELDKDLKSNGINKCYCPEQCMFLDKASNIIQSNKTMDYSFTKSKERNNKISNSLKNKPKSDEHKHNISESLKLSSKNKGKNKYCAKCVAQYDLNNNLIKVWDYIKQASNELKIDSSSISKCCRGKLKTAGGYVWKYFNSDK